MTNEPSGAPRFKLEHTNGVPISDDEIIADMRRVALGSGGASLPLRLYESVGSYSYKTASRRFGSWNAALKAAGLPVLNEVDVTDEELFGNIEQLWLHLGRQPRKRELVRPLSRFSEGPYTRRFGAWRQALEAFVRWAENTSAGGIEPVPSEPSRRQTPRDPNSALRWRVADRDGFRCRHCGKSPALNAGVLLQIDHVVPWSKGGETVFENLQTLCSDCNIGKGAQRESDG